MAANYKAYIDSLATGPILIVLSSGAVIGLILIVLFSGAICFMLYDKHMKKGKEKKHIIRKCKLCGHKEEKE